MSFHIVLQLSGSLRSLDGWGTNLKHDQFRFLEQEECESLHQAVLVSGSVDEVHIAKVSHHLCARNDLDLKLLRSSLINLHCS